MFSTLVIVWCSVAQPDVCEEHTYSWMGTPLQCQMMASMEFPRLSHGDGWRVDEWWCEE